MPLYLARSGPDLARSHPRSRSPRIVLHRSDLEHRAGHATKEAEVGGVVCNQVASKRSAGPPKIGFALVSCRQHRTAEAGVEQSTAWIMEGGMCRIIEKSLAQASRRRVRASIHDFNDGHHAKVFMECDVAVEHKLSGKIGELDPNGNRAILVSLARRNIDRILEILFIDRDSV